MSAANASKATAKGVFGKITFDGTDYEIVRKPPLLLLSELAETQSGDPDSMGMFAEFFKVVLGDNDRAFRKAVFYSEAGQDEEVLGGLLGEVVEQTIGRPTN